ncbi:MAG TPA: hypothetical protein VIS48_16195 [Candidatus Kryptonia bacterium]
MKAIVFLMVVVASAAYSQPYYYYFKYNAAYNVPGYSGDIYRVNLATNGNELFARDAGRVNGPILRNSDQSRIFFQVRFSLATIEVNDPSHNTKYVLDGMNEVVHIMDSPKTNRYYVSFMDMRDNTTTVAVNRMTLEPIDTIFDQNTAYDSFSSYDQNGLYRLEDDSTGIFFSEYYIDQKQQGKPRRCGNVGPFAGSPAQEDTRSGYALVSYTDSLNMNLASQDLSYAFSNQKYVLCNVDQNAIYTPIGIPFRSDGFLTVDTRHVVIEQANFDTTRTGGEYRPGNVYVFDAHAGTLLERLKLPPEGKILLFDNYPNMLYYYLEAKRKSINIDLTKLATIGTISPQNVLVGSGSFTLSVPGKNFTTASKVQLNGTNRATAFVSDTLLQATVRAGDIDTVTVAYIAVRDSIAPSSHAATDSSALNVVSLPQQSLQPILDCVTRVNDSTYTAWFGYENDDTTSIFVPVGAQNKFSPVPNDRTQPTLFEPGKKDRVFSVVFNGKNLTWKLNGNEVTASRKSSACN